jgi:hypothetical protein
MISPNKREDYHHTKETDQGQRSSTRIYKKQQTSQAKRHLDRQSKRSAASKGSKTPNNLKPSSSTKEHKLETFQCSRKGSHVVIEIHEDSDIVK